jgi:hypothetical protein
MYVNLAPTQQSKPTVTRGKIEPLPLQATLFLSYTVLQRVLLALDFFYKYV